MGRNNENVGPYTMSQENRSNQKASGWEYSKQSLGHFLPLSLVDSLSMTSLSRLSAPFSRSGQSEAYCDCCNWIKQTAMFSHWRVCTDQLPRIPIQKVNTFGQCTPRLPQTPQFPPCQQHSQVRRPLRCDWVLRTGR